METNEKPDIVFKCKKCGHLLFVPKDNVANYLLYMLGSECESCGEEGPIWILEREGNYDEEYEEEG